jgi:hypothetical protein
MTRKDLACGVLFALLVAGASLLTRSFVVDALFHRPPMPLDTVDLAIAAFSGFLAARIM